MAALGQESSVKCAVPLVTSAVLSMQQAGDRLIEIADEGVADESSNTVPQRTQEGPCREPTEATRERRQWRRLACQRQARLRRNDAGPASISGSERAPATVPPLLERSQG
eukprot:SM000001S04623  [mRNA]  locus=s1:1276192:1277142:- [translate_table: standard]